MSCFDGRRALADVLRPFDLTVFRADGLAVPLRPVHFFFTADRAALPDAALLAIDALPLFPHAKA
jgi:hypothetical protein